MIVLSLLGALLAHARNRFARAILPPRPILRPYPYFQDEAWLLERELFDRYRRD